MNQQRTGDPGYPVMRYDAEGRFISGTGEPPAPVAPRKPSALQRFLDSMPMDFERWHDGIGYDLAALAEMTAEEREELEVLLLSRGVNDWRDVQALAALNTERSLAALRHAMESGNLSATLAVAEQAPQLTDPVGQATAIVAALETAQWFEGLGQALDLAAAYPTPAVIDTLWRGLEMRGGDVAVHFAALLAYLHGLAGEPFDLEQRPFFLTFNSDDPEQRRKAIDELRQRIAEVQR
jgi:hypothetical protein